MTKVERVSLALPLLALLAGCNPAPHQSLEDREATIDCQQESDRIFAARNRYQLSERPSPDTPYSANNLPATPNDGLGDQYQREQLLDSCLARSSTESGAEHAPGSGK